MQETLPAQQDWAPTHTRRQAKLRALVLHPQAWLARTMRRQRGVATRIPVPTAAEDILERLNRLPISVWTYGYDHDTVRHMGPMAQDFAAAFGLGDNDRRINLVDANGVVMAALQALTRRVSELQDQVDQLQSTDGVDQTAEPARGSLPPLTFRQQ